MKRRGLHILFLFPSVLIAALLLPAGSAAHGGGTPRLINEPVGPYWLSVWTAPEPPRTGEPLHLTIGLSEPGTGREAGAPVLGAAVQLRLVLPGSEATPVTVNASNEKATNRLFYEADVTLPQAGTWETMVTASGPAGEGSASFVLEVVEGGGPDWLLLGGGGLLLVGALFFLLTRKRHPRS